MKKLAALALLAALTLSACGDKDSDKESTEKDTNDGTSQTTDSNETTETDGGEAPEASGDRPTVDEVVALIEQGGKSTGMEVPKSLAKCMAKGLVESDLSDEQVNDYLAAKADKETTDVMVSVTSECAGM